MKVLGYKDIPLKLTVFSSFSNLRFYNAGKVKRVIAFVTIF